MYRLLLVLTLLISSQLVTPAEAAEDTTSGANYYVSDEIGVVLRSGPTNRYRVIGKIAAGTPIEVLQTDEDNGSSQVRTADGDSGWILSEYITDQPTIRAQHAQLEQQNAQLKQQVAALKQQVADKDNIIELNNQLQQQVSELQNESDKLRQQNSLLKDRFHSDVFYAGALVLLIGMLISWILSRFSMKRRQRSGWR